MPTRIEIPAFPRNKRIAVTLSFDDGVATDLPVLDRFNSWGLKATWNLNSGRLGAGAHASGHANYLAAEQVAKAYAGHEVAVHTVTHPWLDRLEPLQIAREVLEDRAALEDLVGYPVRGMAYPFGTYNPRVIDTLRALGIVYARTVETRQPCFPPAEPLAWAATAHQYESDLAQKWSTWYDSTWFKGVFFIWGHTYEFPRNNDAAAVERIFKPLANKPDVWYCTNIELFDYENARTHLVIAANKKSAFNPSALAVTILADNKPIEIPAGQTITLND